ncbi:MAG: DHA3 family macrolide efflux protein-like MFS transporter [Arenicella sp.]
MPTVSDNTTQKINRKALALIFVANATSGFAQGISMLAIPWYFAQQEESGTFNFYYAIITFLTLIWSPNAGAIVDRFNRKKVFLLTNISEGFVIGVIALVGFYFSSLPQEAILLVFLVTILGYHIHYPNLYAFAQEITPKESYTSVASTLEVVGQSTSVASGILGAILLEGAVYQFDFGWSGQVGIWELAIPKWEIWEIFAMDACTYGVSILLISTLRYIPVVKKKVETGPLSKRLKTGLRFLYNHPYVFIYSFFAYAIFINMLVMLHALLPSYVKFHLEGNGTLLGFHELCNATGALMAGILCKKLFEKLSLSTTMIILLLITSVSYLFLAFQSNNTLFLFIGFVIGFANSGARIFRVTYVFDRVPNELIGRVNSVMTAGNTLMRGIFISLFTLPFFVEESVIYAYFVLAIFTLLASVVIWVNRKNF